MCTFQPRVQPRVIKDDTEDETEVCIEKPLSTNRSEACVMIEMGTRLK